ncbi:MAG: hypothetical protein HUK08_00655 [Bacteroidaceae bacterium]|nr:hypothetical protein [Bacteroidaceae bacterium]
MHRFIKETALFLLLIVVGLGVLYNLPRNPNNYMIEYDVKMRMVEDPDRPSAIILLGGSATAFAYNSEMLQDSVGIPVINAGLHAGIGQQLIVDDLIPRLHKGDIVIYSPEYSSYGHGDKAVNDLLKYSDMLDKSRLQLKHWYNVLNNLPFELVSNIKYLLSEIRGNNTESIIYDVGFFNDNGDITVHWSKDDKRYNGEQAGIDVSPADTASVNHVLAALQGTEVYYFPPPLAESSYLKLKPIIDEIGAMFRNNGIPAICNASEEVYPDTTFYDTRYHLRGIGAEERTKHLISLLKQRGICCSTH